MLPSSVAGRLHWHWRHIIILFIRLSFVFGQAESARCSFKNGEYDLSPLDWPLHWNITVPGNDGKLAFYQLSLCSPLSGECKGGAICRTKDATSVTLGTYTSEPKFNPGLPGFWLHYTGATCKNGQPHVASINFYCGVGLGSPELMHSSECDDYFEWQSSVACAAKSTRKEVPCYVYDRNHQKRDLSLLTRETGSYQVDSSTPAIEFYINVCSNIRPGGPNMISCGGAACRKIGSQVVSFGQALSPLRINEDGNLQLIYSVPDGQEQASSNCDTPPKTTVTFVCPHRGKAKTERKYSRFLGPMLTQSSTCHYQVEWVTENACAEEDLVSSSCKLNEAQHGVVLDLSALQKKNADAPYSVNANVNGEELKFYLNVCDGISDKVNCGDDALKTSAVCVKSSSAPKGLILGSMVNKELRYADGELTLTYNNGDKCPTEKNSLMSTVIDFKCNKTSGLGHPAFNQKMNCSYFFTWDTSLACISAAAGSDCMARDGSRVVDLSLLVKHTGTWDVSTATVPAYDKAQIILNVCGPVNTMNIFSGCPSGSAVCIKQRDGTLQSLGRYETSPEFVNGKFVRLKYTQGSPCPSDNSRTLTTVITFNCKPGASDNGPVLRRVSEDQCTFEIEWATASACVQAVHTGKNCKVFDDELQLYFDLSPLRKRGSFYRTSNSEYDFYLNVCEESANPLCGSLGRHAACQVKRSNSSQVWNLGLPSDEVNYYNGLANITYVGGSRYSDGAKPARRTTISFLCDPEAGMGQPKFVEEVKGIYNFQWLTNLVCPSKSVECLAKDDTTLAQYDLSSLTRTSGQTNWEVPFENNGQKKKLILNVCRPILGNIPGCLGESAACLEDVTGNSSTISLGSSIKSPTVEKGGILRLEYDMGDPCQQAGGSETYKVILHLMCFKDTNVDSIKFSEVINQCTYIFFWETKAACAIQDLVSASDCSITDPDSKVTYNLHSLKGKYSVTDLTSNTAFEIGLCGTHIPCSNSGLQNVTACAKVKTGKEEVLGLSKDAQLSLLEPNRLLIVYKGSTDNKGSRSSVEIALTCKPDGGKGEMKFTEHDQDHYLFEMETEAACAPAEMECSISDKDGNSYDLSRLARSDKNWEVEDTRPEHHDLRYYINVCRPLVLIDADECRGSRIGACQIVKSIGKGFNLGKINQGLHVSGNGEITLRYDDGSPCHDNQFQRSLRIEFHCSPIEQQPIFVEETPECEYIISWNTPAACPVQVTEGQNCQVQDPQFGNVYDLTFLKSQNPYTVIGKDHTYTIGVCSSVNCGDTQDVGVCQSKDSQVISAGQFNDRLAFKDGELTLTYRHGKGKCHGKYERTSKITFVCNMLAKGGPVFLQEFQNCSYSFIWETPLACPPTLTDCTTRDSKGILYDLSSLSLSKDSHVYILPNGTLKFLINVCRSIQHTSEPSCEKSPGVCLVNLTDSNSTKKYTNLGKPLHGPYIENDVLKLKYEMGNSCTSDKTYQSVITFHCDKSKLESEPIFEQNDGCVWHFVWDTAAACPMLEEDIIRNDCTAVNPETNFQFDLNPLRRNLGYTFSDDEGHNYTVNVCQNISSSPCGPNVGSCQWSQNGHVSSWNAGVANSKLQFHQGVLFLTYSGGAPCHGGKYFRNTDIEFVCSTHSESGPVFLDETDDCTYYVAWHTPLACEKQVHCQVDAGNHAIDLSPLMKYQEYYTATSRLNDYGVYLINLCRPLDPVLHVKCPEEAAVCRFSSIHAESPGLSLGQIENPPYVDKNGQIVIEYKNGSPCENKPHLKLHSRIMFICGQGNEQGMINLIEITEECEYVFEWITNRVCQKSIQLSYTGPDLCTFANSTEKISFDLSPLKFYGLHHVQQDSVAENNTSISICNGSPLSCGKEAAACKRSNSMGTFSSVTAAFEDSTLKLRFQNGSHCQGSQNWSSEIWFICDIEKSIGNPILVEENPCQLYFHWKTSLVCQSLIEECTVLDNNNHLLDFRILANTMDSWHLHDSENNEYWINLCHELPFNLMSDKNRCHSEDTICMRTSEGQFYSLGRLATQNFTIQENNSVVLTYDGESSPQKCNSEKPMRTSIFLRCGKGRGSPKLVSSSNCHYQFDWHTVTACHRQRNIDKYKFSKGIIHDKILHLDIDLSALNNQLFAVQEQKRDYQYEIVLDPESSTQTACKTTGVCQKSGETSNPRTIGELANVQVHGLEDGFELVLPSNTPCGNSTKNASTLITFQCISSAEVGEPQFLYESMDCVYIFNWPTSLSCLYLNNIKREEEKPSQDSMSAGSIFAIVGVVLGVLLLVVFAVNRQSWRDAASYKLRQLWRRTRKGPSYLYSVIPQQNEARDERTSLLSYHDERHRIHAIQDDDSDDEVLQL